MTDASKLADRLVGRLFGNKRTPTEPVPQPEKPRSVKARLEERQKARRASSKQIRQVEML